MMVYTVCSIKLYVFVEILSVTAFALIRVFSWPTKGVGHVPCGLGPTPF